MKFKHLLIYLLLCISIAPLFAQSNQYLHFDRNATAPDVKDYVRLDGGSQYITGTSTISMAGWFYTDALVYGQGLIGFRGNGEGFYLIQLNNGELECRLQTSTGLHQYIGPAGTMKAGRWQHVAWVYNGLQVTLFIDGVATGNASASGRLTNGNIPFTIGRSILTNLDFYFGGRADEVSVWTKALTATDIQNMMMNELTGNEPDLQLYYKFNQGQPGGNNTSISKLKCELGGGSKDADLIGFALTGNTSNFGGTLNVGFQAIAFPEIPNKLTTDAPFKLDATASSMLPVNYTIVSGPATVSNDTVTLTGAAGLVTVTASQPGDGTWNPAADVTNTFWVVDPQMTVPTIDLRNPLAGDVVVPNLSEIQLAAIVDTEFPELLSVTKVEFEINGDVIRAHDWGNLHYTGWWAPPSHGSYTLAVKAYNNFGAVATETATINIIPNNTNQQVTAFSNVWLSSSNFVQEMDAELPSFLGAYDQVTANLNISCPPGGCGEWDRVAKIWLQTHEGNWVEIIRYITPYGTACSHSIDVTDFISALQGKIRFRASCETFDNGYEYTLTFDYQAGIPPYRYSSITPVWHQTYDFGNFANLKPVTPETVNFATRTTAAKLKLIASGHGWGNNNTSNAAEFFETTHHIWVDGSQTFAHYNWLTCNPNPDNCQPQAGTWFHNRAGFCPGAISPWNDFNLTPFISNGSASLNYIFDQNYVDLCNANHPSCVTGVTCQNCNDGFNPHLIVASSVIQFGNAVLTSLDPLPELEKEFTVFPNPSNGLVEVKVQRTLPQASLTIVNTIGKVVEQYDNIRFAGNTHQLDLSHLPSGMYVVILSTQEGFASQKLNLVR